MQETVTVSNKSTHLSSGSLIRQSLTLLLFCLFGRGSQPALLLLVLAVSHFFIEAVGSLSRMPKWRWSVVLAVRALAVQLMLDAHMSVLNLK
jgi:hypothetical protein